MLGWPSVEALGLRFWRLTPFDDQYNAGNLGLRTRVTPWACVETDLEFAEPGKHSSQAGQAKVSEGRENWSLLELNLWNVMTMRPGRNNRLGNILCSCTHARRLVGARWCRSAVCHSLIHAVNFDSQNVLPRQTATVAGQKRAERSRMGTWNLHATFHRLGYYMMYIFAKTYCQENGVWSSQIWEKRIILSMLCWIQELSVHTHDAVSVCELLARAQETYYIMKQLAIFLWQTQLNVVESFLSEARQHPGVPCEALKFSSQLPASFLEEVVPVGMHSLQAWKNNTIVRKNNKSVRPLLVASTMEVRCVTCLETYKTMCF